MKRAGLFIVFAGLIVLVIGLTSWITTRNFLRNSVDVEGRIIRLEKFRKQSNSRTLSEYNTYFPVIEFVTTDGQEHVFTSEIYSTRYDDYKIGESIKIKYDRHDPEKAEMDDQDFYKFPKRVSLFGLLLIIGGMIWRRIKNY